MFHKENPKENPAYNRKQVVDDLVQKSICYARVGV